MQAAAGARGQSGRCLVQAAGVKQPETLAAWRDATLAEFSGIDVLVCNAGANFLAPAASISPNGFATVMSTVLPGTWNTVHAFFPHLSQRGAAAS